MNGTLFVVATERNINARGYGILKCRLVKSGKGNVE
jgi:hypothetical protein